MANDRAAVAFEAKKPLEIVELGVEGPKAGEVLVEIMATGICHTDAYTLDGLDSEGIFPSILGHEGAAIVREVAPGVSSGKPGDHIIPLYTPECRQCKSCLSGKTNLCTTIRATQGQDLMPDGTTRFSYKGQPIFHYIGCGVTTGVGAVVNTVKVTPGAMFSSAQPMSGRVRHQPCRNRGVPDPQVVARTGLSPDQGGVDPRRKPHRRTFRVRVSRR